MLYPQSNRYRQLVDISGFWEIRFDPENIGGSLNWSNGFSSGRPIAVPSSWNDQFEDMRDYLGPAWYQTRFELPTAFESHKYFLRFGSVNYLADIWLNGVWLGKHAGGHLPFEYEVTGYLQKESNLLVVLVDGSLSPDRVPPGNVPINAADRFGELHYPDSSFDFFPYCGIHRPVLIYSTDPRGISDLTVETKIDGDTGLVNVRLRRYESTPANARISLQGHDNEVFTEIELVAEAEVVLHVPQAKLWGPDSPDLYTLTVELKGNGSIFDRYTLLVGIREVLVKGDQLLINGKPVYLKGFGRHEDFPVVGRGYLPALIVKDYALMQWTGANSFRTTHYPYSEQMMDMADRLGFLVIDETPAVGLFFHEQGLERRLQLCSQYTQELISRDKNHPSVIAWSLANEPHSRRPAARDFFQELYDLARTLDPTRPVTIVSHVGVDEQAFEFVDFLCLNRYYAWYSEPGQIELGCQQLDAELDELYHKFQKPIVLSEFGADTLAGCHAEPPEMFSEEYQAELLARYIAVLRTKPYMIGEHVWNLCDFKTGQMVRRMGGLNLKGVFTRERKPKMAAHRLRQIWQENEPDR